MQFAAILVSALATIQVAHPEIEPTSDPRGESPTTQEDNGPPADPTNRDEDRNYFTAWGVGPSITYDVFNRPRVENARVENGVIRGDEQANASASLLLEMHFMRRMTQLTPGNFLDGNFCGGEVLCGMGPFIAVQAGSDEIIESIGAGWMWGFRRTDRDDDLWGAGQFNVGIGLVVDPNATTLAPGFELNEPLPPGATDVIVEDDAQVGVMVVFSLSR